MSNLRSTGRTPAPAYTTNGCPRATANDLTHPYLKTSASSLVLTRPHSPSLFLHLTPPVFILHPSSLSSSLPLFLSFLPRCTPSHLLHLASLNLSFSIIPSSSSPSHRPLSIHSEFTHLLSAAVFRVHHAPRPKGFTNRRRATTLPLPAPLRRAPAARRTRAWPCG